MSRLLTIVCASGFASFLLLDCHQSPTAPVHRSRSRAAYVESANTFTDHYGVSQLPAWQLHANAASAATGDTCDVLLVETPMVLDTTVVDALHYGTNQPESIKGGIQKFYRRAVFRGVVYKDSTGRTWTYGNVTEDEAQQLVPCRGL
ncbi:MAG: hypothetical protein M3Q69_16690 [Acidobacteriota bacterium]|nr:hypothetical protein [Acidobacteriota bacterium]